MPGYESIRTKYPAWANIQTQLMYINAHIMYLENHFYISINVWNSVALLLLEVNPIQMYLYTPKKMIYNFFLTLGEKANENLLQKNISQLFNFQNRLSLMQLLCDISPNMVAKATWYYFCACLNEGHQFRRWIFCAGGWKPALLLRLRLQRNILSTYISGIVLCKNIIRCRKSVLPWRWITLWKEHKSTGSQKWV